MMAFEEALDTYLSEAAEVSPRRWWDITPAQLEATAEYYRTHCSECDGDLTDNDWKADVCRSCGQTPLNPF